MSFKIILICLVAVLAANGQHTMHGGSAHSDMAMNTTALPIPDSCVTNPAQANCSTWKYPHANAMADLQSLCNAMHFMSACSVAKACNASGAGPDNPTGPGAANVSANDPQICRIFTQVATVCRLDTGMSRMKGCTNYNTMCGNGSLVPMCQNMTGIAVLPTTRTVNERVRSICMQMDHTGCSDCRPSWENNATWGDCDLLKVYDTACGEMPEMEECKEWDAMCTADPSLIFCKSHPSYAPGKLVKAPDGSAAAPGALTAAENTTASTVPGAQSGQRSNTGAAVMQLGVALLCILVALVLV